MIYNGERKKNTPVHFYRPPDFCQRQYEIKEWTISSWTRDQEAELYHKMTIRWVGVRRLLQDNPWGFEGPEGPKAKMAFMVTYNIDRVKDFVFQSSFLKRYKIKSAVLKKLEADDVQLLKIGFEWVKVFVWGMQSKDIRRR